VQAATVLYASRPIPSGTPGNVLLMQGLVRSKPVASGTLAANVLVNPNQLTGKVAAVTVPQGQVLTADQFPEAQTRNSSLRIPPGKTALALQMQSVQGLAGFAGAGDKIDVFGLEKPGGGTPAGGARLVLQGIEVINVNGTAAAPNPGQPGGSTLVFLLAVTPQQAERLIYLSSFEQLYFSLVPKDQQPVAATPGSGPGDALIPMP
jgi:Flp pilus assembly protein CpaB